MPSIEVEGLQEFTGRLEQAADALSQGIAEALQSAGNVFVDSAQIEAPVDTGFLRDNIEITSVSDTEVVIESQAEYSGFQEFGTRYMGAQPYFFQAADTARQEMENSLSNIDL